MKLSKEVYGSLVITTTKRGIADNGVNGRRFIDVEGAFNTFVEWGW